MNDATGAALRLIEEALALEPDRRVDFVRARAGADEALRREAEALLTAEATNDGFLQPPAHVDAAPSAAAMPRAGDRLAGYRLIRRLGAGGMGVVWLAEQQTPRRTVALKLLRAELASGSAWRRLEQEAQILAGLRHPSIAPVYEAGVLELGEGPAAQRVPFLAMEHVEGAAGIVEAARARALPLEERVRLFVDVCDALQHAHERGIVHRDIKPANVLVDGTGRPRVIDFGVARVTQEGGEAASITATGLIPGTLASMSPEQVSARRQAVDARTDVYGLGLLLYELLAEAPPFELAGLPLAAIVRAIREQAPRPLPPSVPRDLAAIVFKALEKAPERRYATAEAMADDARRFLAQEAVHARPPSMTYHVRLFARRHRVLVGAVALLLAGLSTALVVSLAQRADALAARSAEERARRRADALFEDVLGRNLELVASFAPRMVREAGATELAHELVETAAVDLRRLAERAPDDADVQLRVARALLDLGDLRGWHDAPNVGDPRGAEQLYEEVLAQTDRFEAEAGTAGPEARRIAGLAHARLASLAKVDGRADDARRHADAAVLAYEALASRADADVDDRRALAFRLGERASLAGFLGDLEAVPGLVGRQRELLAGVLAALPDDARARDELANAEGLMAGLAYKRHDYALAREHFEAKARQYAPPAGSRPDATRRFRYADARMWEASMLQLLEREDEAEALFEQVAAELQALVEEDPENRQPLPDLGNTAWCLANIAMGRAERAAQHAHGGEAARELWERARAHLERAEAVFRGLEAAGYAPAMYAGYLEQIAPRLERCAAALSSS